MSFFTGIYASGAACAVSPAPPYNDLRRCLALLTGQINTCSEFLLPPAKWFQRVGTTWSTCRSSARPVNTGAVHGGTSGPRYGAEVAYMCAWVRTYTRDSQYLVFKIGTWTAGTEKKKINVLSGFNNSLTWD